MAAKGAPAKQILYRLVSPAITQLLRIINGMSTDVKARLLWRYERQQFPGNLGIFGDED